MSDTTVRALERRYKKTGDPGDLYAFRIAAIRAGRAEIAPRFLPGDLVDYNRDGRTWIKCRVTSWANEWLGLEPVKKNDEWSSSMTPNTGRVRLVEPAAFPPPRMVIGRGREESVRQCQAIKKDGARCRMTKGIGLVSDATKPWRRALLCPGHWKNSPERVVTAEVEVAP